MMDISRREDLIACSELFCWLFAWSGRSRARGEGGTAQKYSKPFVCCLISLPALTNQSAWLQSGFWSLACKNTRFFACFCSCFIGRKRREKSMSYYRLLWIREEKFQTNFNPVYCKSIESY